MCDIESGQELQSLSGHTDENNAVAVSTDARHVVSGSSDDNFKVWNLEKGIAIATFFAEGALDAVHR